MGRITEHLKKGLDKSTDYTPIVGKVKKVVKIIKKHIDTKKGKFPETESLIHQKGPYVGDVGSEKRPKGGWSS